MGLRPSNYQATKTNSKKGVVFIFHYVQQYALLAQLTAPDVYFVGQCPSSLSFKAPISGPVLESYFSNSVYLSLSFRTWILRPFHLHFLSSMLRLAFCQGLHFETYFWALSLKDFLDCMSFIYSDCHLCVLPWRPAMLIFHSIQRKISSRYAWLALNLMPSDSCFWRTEFGCCFWGTCHHHHYKCWA